MPGRPAARPAALLTTLRTALIALALAGCCCPALPPAGMLAGTAREQLAPPTTPTPVARPATDPAR